MPVAVLTIEVRETREARVSFDESDIEGMTEDEANEYLLELTTTKHNDGDYHCLDEDVLFEEVNIE